MAKIPKRPEPDFKIDKHVLSKLEMAYATGCNDIQACFVAEVSRSTLYKYQNRHPEFVERKEQLRQHRNIVALNGHYDLLQKKDPQSIKLQLERGIPEEYGQKHEVNVNHIHSLSVSQLDDQIQHLIDQAKARALPDLDIQDAEYAQDDEHTPAIDGTSVGTSNNGEA